MSTFKRRIYHWLETKLDLVSGRFKIWISSKRTFLTILSVCFFLVAKLPYISLCLYVIILYEKIYFWLLFKIEGWHFLWLFLVWRDRQYLIYLLPQTLKKNIYFYRGLIKKIIFAYCNFLFLIYDHWIFVHNLLCSFVYPSFFCASPIMDVLSLFSLLLPILYCILILLFRLYLPRKHLNFSWILCIKEALEVRSWKGVYLVWARLPPSSQKKLPLEINNLPPTKNVLHFSL